MLNEILTDHLVLFIMSLLTSCRRMGAEEKSNLFVSKTLNDFEAGMILEAESWERRTTRLGEAPFVMCAWTLDDGERKRGKVILPTRLMSECEEKIPCVLYYEGKKILSGGKSCHALRFVNDSDIGLEDTEDNDSPCEECGEKFCYGNCPICGNHQNFNGSQCRCVLKGYS